MATNTNDTEVVSARVSKALAEAVRAMAEAQDMSVSDFVADCLLAGCEAFVKSNAPAPVSGRGLWSRILNR